jgi:tetratricopeptide (TPR) repeat protein
MRKSFLTGLLLLTPALTTVASAASLGDAQALFNNGNWKAAADLALSLKTADGYALAAKSITLGASTSAVADKDKAELFQKAEDYANQAIKADPNNADGYFELARADGRLAQFSGILKSLGLAKNVKVALDKTISLDPKLAGAYVALGLWNAELAGKGFLVARTTGADGTRVQPNFEKAIALEPSNPTHHLEFANALMTLNARNKPAAVAQLQKAITLPATTYWERQDIELAKAKLASLR